MSTTRDNSGLGGGLVFQSNDDVSASDLKFQIEDGRRTEIEITPNNTIYILAATGNASAPVTIQKARNSTVTTTLTLPDDVGPGIDAEDFTRGQSFYDLMIECGLPSGVVNLTIIKSYLLNSTKRSESETTISYSIFLGRPDSSIEISNLSSFCAMFPVVK